MSRIFLIHGWTGSADKDWFPWAKNEFQKNGYTVIAPRMPDPDYPKIEPWIEKIQTVVGQIKSDDIFIGHSIGCQAIERYLQTLSSDTVIDKVIQVAPWVVLTPAALDNPQEDNKIVDPWYHQPINYSKIKKMANQWIAIFSNNDPWVSYQDNYPTYRDQLNAEIILKKNKGHFTLEDGVTQLPLLLEIAAR